MDVLSFEDASTFNRGASPALGYGYGSWVLRHSLGYQLKLLILVGIRYQMIVLQYGGITLKYDDSLHHLPVHYIINVLGEDDNTYSNSIVVHCNHQVDPCYVSIIPVNVIGYGPSTTINVGITPTMTSSSVTNTPSSVTLTINISTNTSVIYMPSTSMSSTIDEQSSSISATTSTSTSAISTSTPVSTSTTVSTTAAGASNIVSVISGAIGSFCQSRNKKVKAILYLKSKYSTDTTVTPTYDEIIVKPTTTTGVPIYDTPMELQANTAYDRPSAMLIIKKLNT
uniref:Uncharacterized protein n=1 Tax=Amphimedon queenslandica TaxID=400682 RepID=A0A1X7U9F7_AMPQE